MNLQRSRVAIVVGVTFAVFLSAVHAQQTGKKEHTFRGKVEQVDAKAKTMSVDGEAVEGWMAKMKMTYKVDKDEVLQVVKPGDQITAKVYDGDFSTLHDVKVVPPEKKP